MFSLRSEVAGKRRWRQRFRRGCRRRFAPACTHGSRAPRLLPTNWPALPFIGARLRSAGVELRCDPGSLALIPGGTPAAESDWPEEYLDLVIAIKIVADLPRRHRSHQQVRVAPLGRNRHREQGERRTVPPLRGLRSRLRECLDPVHRRV